MRANARWLVPFLFVAAFVGCRGEEARERPIRSTTAPSRIPLTERLPPSGSKAGAMLGMDEERPPPGEPVGMGGGPGIIGNFGGQIGVSTRGGY